MQFAGKNILRLALTAILLAAVLYTSTHVRYFPYTLFGAPIVLGMIRRAWVDWLWVLGGGLTLAVLDYSFKAFDPTLGTAIWFALLAAFAVLGIRTVWANGEERKLLIYGFFPVVLFLGVEYAARGLLYITESLHPKTFDLFLYSFDCSLRVQFPFLVGQIISKWHWLQLSCFEFYAALPLIVALVYAAQLRYAKSNALPVLLTLLAAGPLGLMFYNLLPACGPAYLFGAAFPRYPWPTAVAMRMSVLPIPINGAPNAMPSLHMAWVLLCWWNSRDLPRWVRAIALAFVWFTVLATLGTGEHYFVDLVVAFPFSLMVQALCSYHLPFRSGERRTAFLFGMFVTLLWLALLSFTTKFFWISPLIPWAMIVATISSSVVVWHRLLQTRTPELPAPYLTAAAGAGA